MLTTSIKKHKTAILIPRFLHKLNMPKHEKFKAKPKTKGKIMAETYRKEIVQRITKNLLDIQLLRLIQAQPQIIFVYNSINDQHTCGTQ
jgi:hypothetical protein